MTHEAQRQYRDPTNGQYAYDGDFDRLCTCGHTLGIHIAGGFECINIDLGDGTDCDCRKFKPVRSAATVQGGK